MVAYRILTDIWNGIKVLIEEGGWLALVISLNALFLALSLHC